MDASVHVWQIFVAFYQKHQRNYRQTLFLTPSLPAKSIFPPTPTPPQQYYPLLVVNLIYSSGNGPLASIVPSSMYFSLFPAEAPPLPSPFSRNYQFMSPYPSLNAFWAEEE